MKVGKQKVTYAILGAGFAGASLAYHLLKKGAKDVLLLEQEPLPGQHASGRNAGMIRQTIFDESLATLATRGTQFLHHLPKDWPDVTFRRCGSLLLGKGEALKELDRAARNASLLHFEVQWFSKEEICKKIPLLRQGDFEKALFCPSDGVVDIQAFLKGYLSLAQKAGLRFLKNAKPLRIKRKGEIFLITTEQTVVEADILVNAAGAWAGEVSQACGGNRMPLNPCRRHLFYSEKGNDVSPDWPFIWDVAHQFYFRPEAGGVLFSPCDEDPMPPGDCPVEPSVQRRLTETLARHLPPLAQLRFVRSVAGLRTLTPDGRFIIGFDPRHSNLFWVAGLGGHGVTASFSIGDLASDILLSRPHDHTLASVFSPRRFLNLKDD